MMPTITVQNRQHAVTVNVRGLQRYAEKAVELCFETPSPLATDLASAREIGVVLISDRRMGEMHREFLQIDGPTDVITFQHGEIFISAETAKRQAREFGSSLRKEIELYLVHGLLHLHGFDDTTAVAAKKMRRVQTRLVEILRGES